MNSIRANWMSIFVCWLIPCFRPFRRSLTFNPAWKMHAQCICLRHFVCCTLYDFFEKRQKKNICLFFVFPHILKSRSQHSNRSHQAFDISQYWSKNICILARASQNSIHNTTISTLYSYKIHLPHNYYCSLSLDRKQKSYKQFETKA